MSTIQVNHIKARIKELFEDKIDLSDVKGDPSNLKSHFLTRSLAAYQFTTLQEPSVIAAAAAITDGSDDNGIDA